MSEWHLGDRLVTVFDRVFRTTEGTVLRGGAAEPYYEPGSPSVIHFREDFDRSALHEVAHWCVAGSARLHLPDYGYWYAPDGRNTDQQSAFYGVEVKPQAIEALFCEALKLPFTVSVDNLAVAADCPDIADFEKAVNRQIAVLRQRGLPRRAQRFVQALTLLTVDRQDP